MDSVKAAIAKIADESEPLGEGFYAKNIKGGSLREYQVFGADWLGAKFSAGHGAILADEMGLGKTLQTVAFLLGLHGRRGGGGGGGASGRSLIVCPLSVLNNWSDELAKFAPQLTVRVFAGDKAERERLRRELLRDDDWSLVLSTYELCLKDEDFFAKFSFDAMIVDEGHRLKNSNSQLHQALRALKARCRFILTGTPIQNNLDELFTLLSFVAPKVFRLKLKDQFIAEVTELVSSNDKSESLYDILKPFLLRRIKEDVLKSLPTKVEVILYHGLTALQKKYYKAILTKNIDAFDTATGNKTRLLNIQMQLRKCINHPYLFDGVEPEPFQPGEHLVTASAKLILIDRLLKYLKANGHKVLMFSQMTHMLDILQDYLTYRGFTYERLDGSVRGEERFLAVKNFNQTAETFVFLLSTRAGGVGLNLVSADTVIFVDSDFNPQNDLQAAARVHRIGQTRNVKIIRLAGKNTIEEIILRRAESKLALTKQVIGHGKFSLGFDDPDKAKEADASKQLREIIKFGLSKLMDDIEDADAVSSVDFGAVLGPTEQPGGRWVWSEPPAAGKKLAASSKSASADETAATHMYMWEGKDYSSGGGDVEELQAKDETVLQTLLTDLQVKETAASGAGRELRGQAGSALAQLPDAASSRRQPRRPLTEAEKAERRARREAAAADRAAEAEAAARRREERRAAKWRAAGYTSHSVTMTTDRDEDEADDEEVAEPRGVGSIGEDEGDGSMGSIGLSYVIGDVAEPQEGLEAGAAIVCQSVDDAGRWGSGGVFAALETAWPKSGLGAVYEAAGKLGDLRLGDLHLLPLGKRGGAEIYCGLLVCQDSSQLGRPIQLRALQQCLEKLRLSAIRLPRRLAAAATSSSSSSATAAVASVHLPRLGHGLSAGLSWYGVERNLQKLLARRGVPAFIYYFPRKRRHQRSMATADEAVDDEEPEEAEAKRPRLGLADIFTGRRVGLAADLSEADADQLSRYLLAYDADVQLVAQPPPPPDQLLDFLVTLDASNGGGRSAVVAVTPEWVHASVAAGRCLPAGNFSPKAAS